MRQPEFVTVYESRFKSKKLADDFIDANRIEGTRKVIVLRYEIEPIDQDILLNYVILESSHES